MTVDDHVAAGVPAARAGSVDRQRWISKVPWLQTAWHVHFDFGDLPANCELLVVNWQGFPANSSPVMDDQGSKGPS